MPTKRAWLCLITLKSNLGERQWFFIIYANRTNVLGCIRLDAHFGNKFGLSGARWVGIRLSDDREKYRMFLKLFALQKSTEKRDIFVAYKLLLEIPFIGQFFHSKCEKRSLMHLIWQHHFILGTNCFGTTHSKANTFVNTIGICFRCLTIHAHRKFLHLICWNKMIGYVQRSVKMGEQLFIKYFGDNGNIINFQKTHNFQCKCIKCVSQWKPGDNIHFQSDPNYLLVLHMTDSDFKDPKKMASHKGKTLQFFNKIQTFAVVTTFFNGRW